MSLAGEAPEKVRQVYRSCINYARLIPVGHKYEYFPAFCSADPEQQQHL